MVRGKPEFWLESVRYTRSSKLKKKGTYILFINFRLLFTFYRNKTYILLLSLISAPRGSAIDSEY